MKEVLIKLLQILGWAYWVEITTDNPSCTYYFGPFLSEKDAQVAKGGYIEDLNNEGAEGISVSIKRCKPSDLTIFDEGEERRSREQLPTLSGQPS
jgi:hypothetical protein